MSAGLAVGTAAACFGVASDGGLGAVSSDTRRDTPDGREVTTWHTTRRLLRFDMFVTFLLHENMSIDI